MINCNDESRAKIGTIRSLHKSRKQDYLLIGRGWNVPFTKCTTFCNDLLEYHCLLTAHDDMTIYGMSRDLLAEPRDSLGEISVEDACPLVGVNTSHSCHRLTSVLSSADFVTCRPLFELCVLPTLTKS